MAVNDLLFDEGGAVYNVQSTAIGMVGDGVTDDSAAFYGNITSGATYLFPAGTYLINSATSTLPSNVVLKFEKGAVLKPGSGINIALNCIVLAEAYQIFDLALGTVTFANNAKMSRFLPEWWGMAGDGSTDDEPPLSAMIDAIPDGSVVVFQGTPIMSLHSTWTISNRTNITLTTERDGRQEGSVPRFRWGGAGTGSALISLDRCRNCQIEGFYLDCTSADIGIDIDGYDAYGYGTQCTVKHNAIRNNANLSAFVGVRISETATNNQEYHDVVENWIGGLADARPVTGLSATNGSATLTASAAAFVAGDVGKRIRVQAIGSASTSAPAMLDTTITGFTSSSQVTLATAALQDLSGGYAVIGSGFGTGVRIGASANAKRIGIRENNIFGCEYGIRADGGSFHSAENSFTENDVNLYVGNVTEPCTDSGPNSEYSRQHFVTSGALPCVVVGGRFDVQLTPPDTPYLDLGTNGRLTVSHSATENGFPSTSSTFASVLTSTRLILIANRFSPSVSSVNDLSGTDYLPDWIMIENGGITGDIGSLRFGAISYQYKRNADVVANVVAETDGGPSGGRFIALQADSSAVGSNLPSPGYYIGVSSNVGSTSDGLNHGNFRAFEAHLPVSASGSSAPAAEGLRVLSPALTNGSIIQLAAGVVIEDMAVTGVNAGRGLDQQGTSDTNHLAGRTFQAAPSTAPVDADLAPGQITLYLDETNNTLKVRAKYSDGTTLKSGTVALV